MAFDSWFFFDQEIGMLGGGQKSVNNITVSTYDSAALMVSQIGNRFGLLIFDECHHLPSPIYQSIARHSIAPFRLGLSATIERADGKESLIYDLLGKLVFKIDINELEPGVLAPYRVVTVEIPMNSEELDQYSRDREIYRNFIRRNRIDVGRPGGWMEFIKICSYMPGGHEALRAHRSQKKVAQSANGKIEYIWKLLLLHRNDRVLVFTEDNDFAYRIGRELLLPVLTHKTKKLDRKIFLDKFKSGELNVLVTSKVLNEGIDVPEARIAIIASGSSGVREHVQRLGRILRPSEGKKAVFYELISSDTSEKYVNKRRKLHHAYQRLD